MTYGLLDCGAIPLQIVLFTNIQVNNFAGCLVVS